MLNLSTFIRPSTKERRGFTIVELLIVIVVIAILTTVTIVGYNGIQQRTRDAARDVAVQSIRDSLQLYWTENGHYPNACGVLNTGCGISNLKSSLTPSYISSLPFDPGPGETISYVVGGEEISWGHNYAIHVLYETRNKCKYLGGTTPSNGWWPNSPKC